MIPCTVGVALVAFFAVIYGCGPEFFGGCGVVGAAAAFRRRRDRWWGLAAAAAGVGAGVVIVLGWPFRHIWPPVIVTFVGIAVLRAVGHRRWGRRGGPDAG